MFRKKHEPTINSQDIQVLLAEIKVFDKSIFTEEHYPQLKKELLLFLKREFAEESYDFSEVMKRYNAKDYKSMLGGSAKKMHEDVLGIIHKFIDGRLQVHMKALGKEHILAAEEKLATPTHPHPMAPTPSDKVVVKETEEPINISAQARNALLHEINPHLDEQRHVRKFTFDVAEGERVKDHYLSIQGLVPAMDDVTKLLIQDSIPRAMLDAEFVPRFQKALNGDLAIKELQDYFRAYKFEQEKNMRAHQVDSVAIQESLKLIDKLIFDLSKAKNHFSTREIESKTFSKIKAEVDAMESVYMKDVEKQLGKFLDKSLKILEQHHLPRLAADKSEGHATKASHAAKTIDAIQALTVQVEKAMQKISESAEEKPGHKVVPGNVHR